MSKIIELRAENFKRLKAVQINPDGNVVIISGANAAGKSSCLDAISSALGGAGMSPEKPVREGHDKAKIRVELDDLVVEKTFTSAGSAQLTVMAKDGVKYPSPQAMLDKLVGKLSFDPLAFSRMVPKDQLSTLRTLVQLDFSAMDRDRQAAFDQRTTVNRDLKAAQARLDAAPFHEGVPDKEVSLADLTTEYRRRQQHNRANEEITRKASAAEQALANAREAHASVLRQIEELNEKLASIQGDVEYAEAVFEEARAAANALVDLDVNETGEQMATVEATNQKVRANATRKSLAQTVKELSDRSNGLTTTIDDIDVRKKAALETAKFPVPGLSFDEGGVLFNGIPFSQASSAEKLKVSMAMGIALNPKLRVVLIRDASLLDAESLKIVADMAAKTDSQVWLERVADGDPVGFVIEDGMVAAK